MYIWVSALLGLIVCINYCRYQFFTTKRLEPEAASIQLFALLSDYLKKTELPPKDKVTELLNQDGNIDYIGEGYNTIFMEAIIKKNIIFAEFLLKHGADINAYNKQGFTILMIQAGYPRQDMQIINFLLKNGADPTKKSIYEKTALMISRFGDWLKDEPDCTSALIAQEIIQAAKHTRKTDLVRASAVRFAINDFINRNTVFDKLKIEEREKLIKKTEERFGFCAGL